MELFFCFSLERLWWCVLNSLFLLTGRKILSYLLTLFLKKKEEKKTPCFSVVLFLNNKIWKVVGFLSEFRCVAQTKRQPLFWLVDLFHCVNPMCCNVNAIKRVPLFASVLHWNISFCGRSWHEEACYPHLLKFYFAQFHVIDAKARLPSVDVDVVDVKASPQDARVRQRACRDSCRAASRHSYFLLLLNLSPLAIDELVSSVHCLADPVPILP